ncbi:MAG: hypothetical protein EA422_07610 [Gemmatimonadales bacterium]|nr:MAG: hypothetical protein EA422_07610 [Gemmatimonadales bacterium]
MPPIDHETTPGHPVVECGSKARNGPWGGRDRRGVTLIDVILILVIVGTLTTLSVPAFRALSNDLRTAVTETSGFVAQARSQAMSTSSSVRIRVVSDRELIGERSRDCAGTGGWEVDGRVRLEFREGLRLSGPETDSVLLCFNSRGVSDANPTFVLTDRDGRSREIEVLLGGGIVDRHPGGGE